MLNVMAGYDKLDITSVAARQGRLRRGAVAADLRVAARHARRATSTGSIPRWRARSTEAVAQLGKADGRRVGRRASRHLASWQSRRAGRDVRLSRAVLQERSRASYMLPERRRLQAHDGQPAESHRLHPREVGARDRCAATVDDAFKDFDLVVMPTQRILPPLLDELIKRAHETEPANPRVISNCAAVQCHAACRPSRFLAASARAACRSAS